MISEVRSQIRALRNAISEASSASRYVWDGISEVRDAISDVRNAISEVRNPIGDGRSVIG